MDYLLYRNSFLAHSGVPKMRWYHRRYQNYDGSLTPLGRIHYGVGPPRDSKPRGDAISIARARTSRERRNRELNQVVEKRLRDGRLSSASGKLNVSGKANEPSKSIERGKTPDFTEEDRLRIIRSGSASEICEHLGQYTSEELQKAITRIEKENQLKALAIKEASTSNTDSKDNDSASKNNGPSDNKNASSKKDKHEEARLKALKSGTAAEVLRYQGECTNDELQTAINRLDKEATLRSKAYADTQVRQEQIRRTAEKLDNLVKAGKSLVGFYNFGANIVNGLSGENKWKTIKLS